MLPLKRCTATHSKIRLRLRRQRKGYSRLRLSCQTRVYPLMPAHPFPIKSTNIMFLQIFASDKFFLWLSSVKNHLSVLCLPFTLRDKHRYQGNTVADKLASGEIGRATSELQSRFDLVCRLLLEKKKQITK